MSDEEIVALGCGVLWLGVLLAIVARAWWREVRKPPCTCGDGLWSVLTLCPRHDSDEYPDGAA